MPDTTCQVAYVSVRSRWRVTVSCPLGPVTLSDALVVKELLMGDVPACCRYH